MEDQDSLLKDLAELGLNPFLLQGKDFGFASSLQQDCDGTRKLWFTQGAVERLIKHGIINSPSHTGMGSFRGDFNDTWQSTYLVRFILSKSTGEDGLWYLWGTCGDSGFGTGWLKYQFGPRTIKRLQTRLVDKIKAMRF